VIVAAAGSKALPASIAALCEGVKASAAQSDIAKSLSDADNGLVLLGCIAGSHGASSAVRALAAAVADLTGAKLGYVSEGANSSGAHLAGFLPNRQQGGTARADAGLDAASILNESLDVVVLVNIEPDVDIRATDDAVAKLAKQDFVIAMTPFVSDSLLETADLLLPVGTFAETSGTFVNVAGTWQSFGGVAHPIGEARPAWKVLRVLGNLVDAPDFDYVTSEDVRDELSDQLGNIVPDNKYSGSSKFAKPNGEDAPSAEIDTPLYSVDGMVRRANALQLTSEARRAAGESDS
jgi:NADH-quinone oxidoreductase subunit G